MQVAKAIFNDFDTIFNVYDLTINACDDCKVCHYSLNCKFDDDMSKVLDTLNNCDHLVLVSPIYFGSLSDQLMKLINRFQVLFEQKFTHQKAIIKLPKLTMISTCAAKDEGMFDGAKLTLKILENLFDVKEVNKLFLTNTDMIDDICQVYQEQIYQFKKSINPQSD